MEDPLAFSAYTSAVQARTDPASPVPKVWGEVPGSC
jgi:hypothetical protein